MHIFHILYHYPKLDVLACDEVSFFGSNLSTEEIELKAMSISKADLFDEDALLQVINENTDAKCAVFSYLFFSLSVAIDNKNKKGIPLIMLFYIHQMFLHN